MKKYPSSTIINYHYNPFSMKKVFLPLVTVFCCLLLPGQVFAGSGYYLGADYLRNFITEDSDTAVITLPSVTPVKGSSSEKKIGNDYGLRFGYKHRISQYFYIAPEFSYSSIDESGYLYSTTMKSGFEVAGLSFYGALGYSENDYFNGSSENYGGGLAYKINDNFSLEAEYVRYGDIIINRTSSNSAGTNSIKKNSQLETLKFGITYYFHE